MPTALTQDAAAQPIACLLDRESYLARLDVIAKLNSEALLGRKRQGNVLYLAYRNQGDVEARVRELVALEQECCPFFTFAVAVEAGEIRLTVSAPEEGVALLDEVFTGGEPAANSAPSCKCCGG
ncbi:MAG TPA: hypothetical protein VEY95_18290 [Azospirillaceae bacterium]|nr:hypothetical protein [Azospirillaceae bacterium]